MLTHEITRTKRASSNPIQSDKSSSRKEVLQRHFCRFSGEIGDQYVFKRPKRPKVIWEVVGVELDETKVHWAHGGNTPQYIHLRGVGKDKNGNEIVTTLWTCENKIRLHQKRKQ